MTASGLSVQRTLVWDTSPLLHAIKSDVIDRLGELAITRHGAARRNVTTAAVLSEITYHGLSTNQLTWLDVVHVDDLAELDALVRWTQLVSGQKSNHGEATVLAWAEVHNATAVIDDTDARRAAQKAGQSKARCACSPKRFRTVRSRSTRRQRSWTHSSRAAPATLSAKVASSPGLPP